MLRCASHSDLDGVYLTPKPGTRYRAPLDAVLLRDGNQSNAQVLVISRGEQSPRAAHITWTGLATWLGGPRRLEAARHHARLATVSIKSGVVARDDAAAALNGSAMWGSEQTRS
jgi:hypothetical protein